MIRSNSFPRGVSLIELVVVIAIITVLLAVSLPILSRVRTSSQWVKCASNLRGVGVLTEKAMERFDMSFPYFIPGGPNSPSEGRLSMESVFAGVTTDFQVWACPSNPADEETRWKTSYDYYPGLRMKEHPNEGQRITIDGASLRSIPERDALVWGDAKNWHGDGRQNSISYPAWNLSAN